MLWLALDIGGANLKVSDGKSYADATVFPLWKNPEGLAQEIRKLIAEAPVTERLIVTMTGELADCFNSKEEGVNFILDAVEEAAAGRHTRCYLSDGRSVTFQVARRMPQLAAASNWHALARFAGLLVKTGPALSLDIGSTTCDIIPLQDGVPTTKATTDTERLIAGQLLYTGIERSPVCAVVSQVPYRGHTVNVAQEYFTTMLDAYIILGDLPENTANKHTADGREATKAGARNRLGKLVCADGEEFNHRDAVTIATAASQAQVELLKTQIGLVVDTMSEVPESIVVSGHGDFLAIKALKALQYSGRVILLSREAGAIASRCATAYALAMLMNEAS
ncbi:MAG: putative H4MPT-linked C1 transfer pathway protein [Pirellulaceae bacterium]|jgi:probable H4MPT-linked C1 transfer pathway protein